MGDLIQLPVRSGARIASLPLAEPERLFGEGQPENVNPPRAHFGLREARTEDRADQDRIKRAAREARNAFDNPHVCPELKRALAARITGLAVALEQLAAEAKSYGMLSTTVALREHASLLERESALIDMETL